MITNTQIESIILEIENCRALMVDGDPFKAELSACITHLRVVQRFPEGRSKQDAWKSIRSELEVIAYKLESLGVFNLEPIKAPSFVSAAQGNSKSEPRFESKPRPIIFAKIVEEKRTPRKAVPFFIENQPLSQKPSMHNSAEIYLGHAPHPKSAHINGTMKIASSVDSTESAELRSRLEAISEPFSQGLKIVHEYGKYLDEILRGADEIIGLIRKLEKKLRILKTELEKVGKDAKEYDFLSQDILHVETEIAKLSKVNTLITLINARREKLQELKFLFDIGRAGQITPAGCERLIYEIENFDKINPNTLLRAMKYSGLDQYKDDRYISRNGRRVQNCRDKAVKKFASYELKLKNFVPAIRHAEKSEMPKFTVEVELECSQDEFYVYNKSRKEFIDDVTDIAQHYIKDLDYLSEIFKKLTEKNLTAQEEEKLKNILGIQRQNLVQLQKKCQFLKDVNTSLENISKETKEVIDDISNVILWSELIILFQKIAESEEVKDVSICTRICMASQFIKGYHDKLSGIRDAIEDELTPLPVDELNKLEAEVHSEGEKEAFKDMSSFFKFEKMQLSEKSSAPSELSQCFKSRNKR